MAVLYHRRAGGLAVGGASGGGSHPLETCSTVTQYVAEFVRIPTFKPPSRNSYESRYEGYGTLETCPTATRRVAEIRENSDFQAAKSELLRVPLQGLWHVGNLPHSYPSVPLVTGIGFHGHPQGAGGGLEHRFADVVAVAAATAPQFCQTTILPDNAGR